MTAAHRIGPLEAHLIQLLARYVRATVEQLTRHSHSPNSVRHVRNHLNGLVGAGYVDVSRGFSQDGKPPYVYALSRRGWRYAEEHLGMPIPTRWRPSEAQLTDYRDYLHALAITDLGIAIERFCREAEPFVTFVQFLHDRFLPQTTVPLPDGTRPAIRLDAFVELHIRREESGRKRQRCHLVEIDRGTHYAKALEKKVLMQIHYVKDQHYQRDFGTASLSYLWVCPGGAERVKQLLRIVEETLRAQQLPEFAPLFLFTAADPAVVDPVHLFTRPCWSVPFEAEPVALLAFPAQTTTVRLDRSQYLSQAAYDQFLVASGEEIARVTPEMELA